VYLYLKLDLLISSLKVREGYLREMKLLLEEQTAAVLAEMGVPEDLG